MAMLRRFALLADIHGNLPALEAVLADLAGRDVDTVINLGDCVSGPLWPAETLALLRRHDWPTVRGNHDRVVGTGAPAPLGRTDAFTAGALDADGRDWLAALPGHLAWGHGCLALHACPDRDTAYLTEDVDGGRLLPARPGTVAARLAGTAARVVLTGHSHRPALVHLPDGRTVINPGSVGCPAYDDPDPPAHVSETFSPHARYAVVTLGADGPTAAFIALPYDHAAAAARADALGRPDWAHALLFGAVPEA